MPVDINVAKINRDEVDFLKGPRSRQSEFFFAIKIFREFIKGFRAFHFLGPCVTIFVSARFHEGHNFYKVARNIGQEVSKLGFTVMTGGGPGLMEAANRVAKDVNGRSIGCNIVLLAEQNPNPYLDKWVSIKYFFVRKVILSKYSYEFIVLPGGYGTLDEFFEAITLIQTEKIKHFPVVLIGKEFHKLLHEHILLMAQNGTIKKTDVDLYLMTDSVEEVMAFIEKNTIKKLV
ncbi:MAG: TIGR00730 family Rossman fold protein [Bacteroidota bacterium]|nr:TIGR00730 family Rossman fold protein [Bacteroidota bacterium]